jgi:hypothetical protein
MIGPAEEVDSRAIDGLHNEASGGSETQQAMTMLKGDQSG